MSQYLNSAIQSWVTGDLGLSFVDITGRDYAASTDGFRDEAVERVLRAKQSKEVKAPTNADAFLKWLVA